MKIFLLFFLLFFATLSSLFAEDMDAKMQKIREASPQERVKLMNELKRQIAAMNKEDRDATIRSLQEQMRDKNQIHKNVNQEQFQQSQGIQHEQGRNQQQAGKQYIHNNGQNQMKFSR